MRLKVVYDTNILVSANLKPESLIASLVALAFAKQVRLFYSRPILDEYRDVLARPKFGFQPQTIRQFLDDLCAAGHELVPSQRVRVARHEADNRFLECAQAAKADYLVTGNTKDFPRRFKGTRIVDPAKFAALLGTLLTRSG